jgi:phospholipid/cholesterol/gamma-HCH transport system permease protein
VVDVVSGEVKCILFGAIVAAICIYKGVTASGGAEGVAKAVHSSVVWSFVSIAIFEYLFTPTILALFHTQLTLR